MVCDNDEAVLEQIQSGLLNEGIQVETINDAADLIPRAIRARPSVIIVNPDMTAFNEYDVCKNLMQDLRIAVILMVDKHSTRRNQIDECTASDVVTKPVEVNNLANLVLKHITVNQ